ncbi:major facilitator superfamily domain-containing protein [Blakeslea trispora]|nr:major facilitator superfamily domain-containing protein [Blakeslea trispora]
MMANRYWIILVSKFFQGFSNCSTWLMSFAMISDRWPRQKLGLMVGLIGCLFPLGLSLGSIVSGAFYYYVSYQALLYSVLTVGIMPCLLQIMVIEKTSTLEEWLQPEQNTSSIQGELELKALSYTRTMPETAGKWSKSSSMSTINLNQPPVFEKEMKDTMTLSFKESIFFCLLSSGQFMSLLYQIVAISIIVGTLKSALLLELENHLNIINAFSQSVMTGTFLLPCTVSAFVSGWLCDRFEPKNISLTSVIICVSAFIWIGVPNQNVQSIASALVFSGTTLAALAASTLVTTINIMQQIVFRYYNMRQDIIREQRTSTPIAATVCFTSGIGFFTGIFIKNLTDVIGFFWLCFSLGMLLLTCIPWMLLFAEPKEKAKSMEDIIVFSQSSSKKSIIHSIRPESFAESILSDTEDEEAQEDESTADNFIKSLNSKPVMVAP